MYDCQLHHLHKQPWTSWRVQMQSSSNKGKAQVMAFKYTTEDAQKTNLSLQSSNGLEELCTVTSEMGKTIQHICLTKIVFT